MKNQNDKLHNIKCNEDGLTLPAIEYADGFKYWHINGTELPKEQHSWWKAHHEKQVLANTCSQVDAPTIIGDNKSTQLQGFCKKIRKL